MYNKKDLAVFTTKVAKSMMVNGHYAKNISENKRIRNEEDDNLVFYFENTPSARRTLEEILNEQKEYHKQNG